MSVTLNGGPLTSGMESAFEKVRKELGRSWDNVQNARNEAAAVSTLLRKRLCEQFGRISSSDADIVVFGSLAREEWTSGSDVDWTLLIDGQAKPEHRLIAQAIASLVEQTEYKGKKLPSPGATGIFGNIAFSHDIIHHIGGQNDTNKNTTQRILLLLESAPLRPEEDAAGIGARERVIRGALDRYLHDDTNFFSVRANESRIPRFLLNDIVRFWRTMCVDFACKQWEQAGSKWALRNIKLRVPRKMIFVSGLLLVFTCFDNQYLRSPGSGVEDYVQALKTHLSQHVSLTPLEIVSRELSRLSLTKEAGQLLDVYDEFLKLLNDRDVRTRLETLRPDEVYSDEAFLSARELSHRFQDVLTAIFFDKDTALREFNKRYGVF
jgi:predicted nucleotidyltransferase